MGDKKSEEKSGVSRQEGDEDGMDADDEPIPADLGDQVIAYGEDDEGEVGDYESDFGEEEKAGPRGGDNDDLRALQESYEARVAQYEAGAEERAKLEVWVNSLGQKGEGDEGGNDADDKSNAAGLSDQVVSHGEGDDGGGGDQETHLGGEEKAAPSGEDNGDLTAFHALYEARLREFQAETEMEENRQIELNALGGDTVRDVRDGAGAEDVEFGAVLDAVMEAGKKDEGSRVKKKTK